jgi:bidirectional [NiFe] hydrogenase diaphorase subunit
MDEQTMHIVIDGNRCAVTDGETVLTAARRVGVHIPTLCHHEALASVGACRLCLVEITRKSRPEIKEVVTSCEFPVEDGLTVETRTESVRRQRQTILSLLAARCPDVTMLRELADREGGLLDFERFSGHDNCIMCTLCTRSCAVLGLEAIAPVGRGSHKEIAAPFHDAAELCVGCGTCARICPTKCIEMVDTKDTRKIWKREFRFVKCDVCGAPTITEEFMAHAISKYGLDESYYRLCPTCKQNQTAAQFQQLSEPLKSGAR